MIFVVAVVVGTKAHRKSLPVGKEVIQKKRALDRLNVITRVPTLLLMRVVPKGRSIGQNRCVSHINDWFSNLQRDFGKAREE